MRVRDRWFLFGVFALAALAFGVVAAANDDVSVFNLQERTLIGTATLEPGSYTFRALHVASGPHMIVQVTSVDETTTFAVLRARTEPLPISAGVTTDSLDLDRADASAQRIVSWQLPDKSIRYVFE